MLRVSRRQQEQQGERECSSSSSTRRRTRQAPADLALSHRLLECGLPHRRQPRRQPVGARQRRARRRRRGRPRGGRERGRRGGRRLCGCMRGAAQAGLAAHANRALQGRGGRGRGRGGWGMSGGRRRAGTPHRPRQPPCCALQHAVRTVLLCLWRRSSARRLGQRLRGCVTSAGASSMLVGCSRQGGEAEASTAQGRGGSRHRLPQQAQPDTKGGQMNGHCFKSSLLTSLSQPNTMRSCLPAHRACSASTTSCSVQGGDGIWEGLVMVRSAAVLASRGGGGGGQHSSQHASSAVPRACASRPAAAAATFEENLEMPKSMICLMFSQREKGGE